MLSEPFDVHSKGLMFTDLQPFPRSFVDWNQQILNSFVVDFKHTDTHLVFLILLIIVVDSRENLFTANRHDSLVGTIADHGVALTGAGLSISKQAAVITLPSIVKNFYTNGFKDDLLVCVLLTVGSTSMQILTRNSQLRWW